MKTLKAAILGSNSHIAKGLIYNFLNRDDFHLSLYTRSPKKLYNFLNSIERTGLSNYSVINSYDDFINSSFDIIIYCVGIGTLKKLNGNFSNFFTVTEKFDNLCIENLIKNPNTLYISFSSGAVYGKGFSEPVNENTINNLQVNNLKPEDYYTIARINAETKHRSFDNLKIVDLRIFSYFSRFVDLTDGYLINEIINSILRRETFVTNKSNIVRDYIHHEDVFSLIMKCVEEGFINDVFDVMSSKPIDKFEMLDFFSQEYGLKYETDDNFRFKNSTGAKKVYYSSFNKASRLGFKPRYSSAEVIKSESKFIFRNSL